MKEMLARQMMTVTLSKSPQEFTDRLVPKDTGVGGVRPRQQGKDRLMTRVRGWPNARQRGSRPRYDLVIEKDLEIPMRDGARLKADVFRPKARRTLPRHHQSRARTRRTSCGCRRPIWRKRRIRYMNWETVNPLWWVPRGYAAVRVDGRGRGKSPGRTDPWSRRRGARLLRRASSGPADNRGATAASAPTAISYFAMTQWLVANLKPPSLKAMIPWEGAADMYRDFGYHGGIFSFGFVVNWYNNHMAHHLLGKPQATSPDAFATPWVWEYMRNNLDSDWYHGRRAAWENIDVPALQRRQLERHGPAPARQHRGLYACGIATQEAAHPRRHPLPPVLFRRKAVTTSCAFSITGSKGIDTGIMREPPVKLLIRKGGHGNYEWRIENEWPLKRTRWTKFYPAAGRRAMATKLRRGARHRAAAQGRTRFPIPRAA